ncbi:MAG: BolA family transcriptional regulator [Pseudobdellovibrio sp.]|nr:BolA family transcriptional regulator [Pseudobdellovibrio sp.]
MSRDERIKNILQQLNPVIFELKNDSAKHAGHADHMGVEPTGETHYKLKIVSEVFKGMGRVDRQRKVYDLLRSEFNSGLHALELKTLTPEEVKG